MIINENVLIIPDVHMDINWVRQILEHEKWNFDYLVCLGDWFDSFHTPPQVATTERVCEYLMELKNRLGDSFVYVVGNHDLSYIEAYPYAKEYRKLHDAKFYCSGYSRNRAETIAKKLPLQFWREAKVAVITNGYLITHAGVLPRHWPTNTNTEVETNHFLNNCEDFGRNTPYLDANHPFCEVGFCRGGRSAAGGPFWCDWNEEFVDELPLPQIVGHTQLSYPSKIGRSFNLDCDQSWYAKFESGQLLAKNPLTKDRVFLK